MTDGAQGLPVARTLTAAQRVVSLLAVVAIAIAIVNLRDAASGLQITRSRVGDTPVTVFRPASGAPAPVVVIAHGFAGSQQLMQPFALTLARNGYLAVTFDFLGHGRHPVPMRGDITEGTGITAALLKQLGEVAGYAKTLQGSDGRLAVLGHSMASDIVVRYAQANPEVQATVAVSVFSPVATATSPRNLLVIVGAWEPAMLRDEGLRIVGLAADGTAVAGEAYGDFNAGTARKLVVASAVEHIGVLYSRDSLMAAREWLDRTFGRSGGGFVDSRGVSLALLFAGLIALAWPLSALLPRATQMPVGAGLGWRSLLLAAFVPALLTPLMLWKLPTNFLPILLGDYLALHFLLYGALTAAMLLWLRTPMPSAAASKRAVATAALAVAAYNIIAFGWPIDTYVFSFSPIPARWPVMAAIACGALPYFVADEWLTRGARARGAYGLTKFAFLLSLAIAVALNPMKLFFLAIIVPAILLLFLAFGLISRWCYRATNHPLPGALANAAFFAWAIAVTFPMVVR
ncbi:MAG: alpha/beta fold hydrolase [Tardiphaga sp.]